METGITILFIYVCFLLLLQLLGGLVCFVVVFCSLGACYVLLFFGGVVFALVLLWGLLRGINYSCLQVCCLLLLFFGEGGHCCCFNYHQSIDMLNVH